MEKFKRQDSIDWVDALKAFAILAILLNHFVESFHSFPWFSNPSSDWPALSVRMSNLFPKDGPIFIRIVEFAGWLGDMGPGVFILLSGFTLAFSALNKPIGTIDFYKKRVLRIYPLYITIHFIILVAAKFWFKWDINILSYNTLLSILGLRFNESLFFYINPSWWFIWLIIQMYIFFPFLFILLRKKGAPAFLAISLAITLFSRLAGILGFTCSINLNYWMTGIFGGTRLFEFAFGMYLGYLVCTNNKTLERIFSNERKVLLISSCFYILGFISSWTLVGSIFSNILITIGLSGLFYSIYKIIFKENRALKTPLNWIGKNSFSVFLLHQPFMLYVSSVYNGINKCIALLIVILASFIVGFFIEKLVTSSLRKVQIYKEQVAQLFSSRTFTLLILLIIGVTIATSFMLMLIGYTYLFRILRLFFLILIISIALIRFSQNFRATLYAHRLLDSTLIITFVFLFVTNNWLPVYWILLLSSMILQTIAFRLKYYFALFGMSILLLSITCIIEYYLKTRYPIEVGQWGEYPALQKDGETTYSLIPNRSTHLKYNNYNYYVKTNSLGFTSPEIDLSVKADNEKRILILGDAFSMPEGLEYEHSYPYLLEQALREAFPNYKIIVINAGVTGYGPNEEYAQAKKYFDVIKPDIVINQFFINEFQDINITKEEFLTAIGFNKKKPIKRCLENAQFPVQLEHLWQNSTGLIDKQYYYNMSLLYLFEKKSPLFSDSVVLKISRYLDKMSILCFDNNSKYLIMDVPGQIEVSDPKFISYYPYFVNIKDTNRFDFELPHRILDHLCSTKGIKYIGLKNYLRNYPVQPVYFEKSWHWNKNGHMAVSKYLKDYIIKALLLNGKLNNSCH